MVSGKWKFSLLMRTVDGSGRKGGSSGQSWKMDYLVVNFSRRKVPCEAKFSCSAKPATKVATNLRRNTSSITMAGRDENPFNHRLVIQAETHFHGSIGTPLFDFGKGCGKRKIIFQKKPCADWDVCHFIKRSGPVFPKPFHNLLYAEFFFIMLQ